MNPNCGEFSQQCEILRRESFRNICCSLKSPMCGPEHSKGGEHCNFSSVAATWASPHTNAKGKNCSQQQTRAVEGGRTSGARQRFCLCPEGYTHGGGDQSSIISSACHADIFHHQYVYFRNKVVFTDLAASGVHKKFTAGAS